MGSKQIVIINGTGGCGKDTFVSFVSKYKRVYNFSYNDMAFNSIKDAINIFKNSDDEIMFIHIREPEEIKRAVDAFKAKSLLIKRDGYDNIMTNESDANVENYDYDYIIYNKSIEQLEDEAQKFSKFQ